MGSLNLIQIIGYCGRDPETRYLADGTAVTTISVATTETWKDKNTGEKREETEWHRCVAWRQLGELAGQYLSKGSQVYFSGRSKTRKWEDKEGVERYTTEIVVDKMVFLSPKKSTSDGYHYQGGGEPPGGYAQAPPGAQRPQQGGPRPRPMPPDLPNTMDDDIPF